MLKLPVIFSTQDTQTIVSGFQLAKGGDQVVFEDFELLLGQGKVLEVSYIITEDNNNTAENQSYVDTNQQQTLSNQIRDRDSVYGEGYKKSNEIKMFFNTDLDMKKIIDSSGKNASVFGTAHFLSHDLSNAFSNERSHGHSHISK